MTTEQTKDDIKISIHALASGNLTANALKLFQALGYVTERQAPFHKKTKEEFAETFFAPEKKFDKTKAKFSEWNYVDLLFQLSKEEVLKQTSLFDTKKVDSTVIETYLFFAIELKGEQYLRTDLSLITREVNRLFPMPAMILFRHGGTLTLSIINRRLHKRDESKDVLEKVILIKDINTANPHRAHIEILFDLTFDELKEKFHFTNFVELHNAWQKTLDTKLLNKKFFEELSNWYFWSQQYVEFPNDRKLEKVKNVQINLIRLITRLIFVWFLKEKNLVPENLFDKREIKKLLKTFDPNGEKSKNYYTAILQNLFFATLNQKMTDRKFVDETDSYLKKDHGVKNLFRYSEQFSISETEVNILFKDIPFLNGGLFDCLDKEHEETGKVEYIDGFSRNSKKIPTVPDLLFFGNERTLDLSEGYGYKRNREKCRGLFEIFNDYKFTIEENTPIEEEIALDPELLGKVFENLLAYYNPETEATARKQTGSFYTPREIVNYMVDESLTAYLKTQMLEDKPAWLQLGNLQTEMFGNDVRKGQLKLEQPLNKSRWKENQEELENNLSKLIAYSNDEHPFTDEGDIQQLIYAIDHCKIIDPACGSGAFPMGILHKLVYVLGRLDEDNLRWRELQKRKAQFEIEKALNDTDKKEREKKLIDINNNFEDNASDYGRKLYLIENCIYGVDIQPIAVQISKLRFFISLVVDQKEKQGADNRGIRPLPNLETKFVAANTLIGLEKPKQALIMPTKFYELEKELADVRHEHFDAKSRKDKLNCQKKDKSIRKQIAELLKDSGWNSKDADKIAQFDIYDQNLSAKWFESEWMYGKELTNGFDIVIANPPYIEISGISVEDRNIYKEHFKTATGRFDLYSLFIEKAMQLKKKSGGFDFIIPGKFLNNKQFSATRKMISQSHDVNVVKIDDKVFEASVDSVIIQNHFTKNAADAKYRAYKISGQEASLISETTVEQILSNPEVIFRIEMDDKTDRILSTIETGTKKFIQIGEVKDGIIAGLIKDILFLDMKENKDCKKLFFGKQISRYGLQDTNTYVDYRPDFALKAELKRKGGGAPGLRMREKRIFEREKILYRKVGKEIIAAYDDKGVYYEQTVHSACVTDEKYSNKYVLGIFNSMLLKFYYHKTNSQGGDIFPQVRISSVENLPIKIADETTQSKIERVVDFVICLKRNGKDTSYFESLIDAMVYELYLPEAIKNAKAEVLKHLNNLPELKEDEDKNNLKTIENVYKEISYSKHPVCKAIENMDGVEEIRIIEGKK